MRLVVGTTNQGKVAQMEGAFAGTLFECIPITALLSQLPPVEEVGDSPECIAERKAVAYQALVGEPVLSLDHWLYLDEVPPQDQPRAHVRRIPGHPDGASDDQLIDYYADLCRRHGGRLTARWELGVAVAREGSVISTCIETVRTLVPTPSAVRRPGLPLASLQIDHHTQKYVSEHTDDEETALWQRVYGAGLVDFVSRAFAVDAF